MPDLIPRELVEDILKEIRSLREASSSEFLSIRDDIALMKIEIINSIKLEFGELQKGIENITLVDIDADTRRDDLVEILQTYNKNILEIKNFLNKFVATTLTK